MFAYLGKLMNQHTTANNGKIINFDLTRKLSGIRHYDIIAEDTVVSYVAVCHYKAIVAYHRFLPRRRSSIYGTKLTQHIVVAYFEICLLADKLQVLRVAPDNSQVKNLIALAHLSVFHYLSARHYNAIVAYLYIFANGYERLYCYIFAYFGCRMYYT